MKRFLQILQYFPFVLQGVTAVEQASAAGTPGTAKKRIILDSISAAAKIGEQVPQQNVETVSALIDATVSALNASGLFTHAPAATPAK